MPERKIIYDFGAHNGEDIAYYLLKADRVVAVEANPRLCEMIKTRFAREIADGRLYVENCVLARACTDEPVAFYLHKHDDVLSQFPKPDIAALGDYETTMLRPQSPLGLIDRHGPPYYIKVDLEHYDAEILRAIFEAGIRPPYISAEAHGVDVFAILVALGGYDAFKLVVGATVSECYGAHVIQSETGPRSYSFPYHAAGPFGDDIPGHWMNAEQFFRWLAFEGLGWKDIHATNQTEPDPMLRPSPKHYYADAMVARLPVRVRRLLTPHVARLFPQVTTVRRRRRPSGADSS